VASTSFLLFNSSQSSLLTSATDSTVQYGKISSPNSMLLKSPTKIEDISNSYFILEESYFVQVLNEVSDDYYYVNYLNILGYVKKSDITLVNEEPKNPFLDNITFDIIKPTYIYSEPKINSALQIQFLQPQSNIFYYGKIYGDEINKNSGNVWYYCKITYNFEDCFGYIHSNFTNNLAPIVNNNEQTSEFISQKNEINNLLNLNLTSQTLIIVIISLPILFLIFLLLKGFKKV